MHILIIPSEHYIPQLSPLSGIFQYHHAKLLSENDIKVGVISSGVVPLQYTFTGYAYNASETDGRIQILRRYSRNVIPGRIYLRYFWRNMVDGYVKLYLLYIEKYGIPDIIHAHNSLFAGYAAYKIKCKYGIPYIITEHSSLFERNLIPKSHLRLSQKVYTNADAVTTVSNKLGLKLVEFFGESVESFIPIYNVLEQSFIDEPLEMTSSSDKFNFLSIGSLDENKNHLSLISAFAEIYKGDDSVTLTIGGEGPLKQNLSDLIKFLSVESQVILTGRLSRENVKAAIKNCDVFVLPSTVETFGVVLIEAAALGKPLISTYSGGPEDIVNPANGLLVKPKDTKALANALFEIKRTIHKYNPSSIRNACLAKFGRKEFFERLNNIYLNIKISDNARQ